MPDILQRACDRWVDVWPYILTALDVTVALAASAHAILYKRDARSAVAWVGFIWLVPFLGALLYVLLGINRIRRRARALRAGRPHPKPPPSPFECAAAELPQALGPAAAHLATVAAVV